MNLRHIWIYYHCQIEEANATEPLVANLCGPGPLAPVDTSGNTAKYSHGPASQWHPALRLVFHADGVNQEKQGFLVSINASVEGE